MSMETEQGKREREKEDTEKGRGRTAATWNSLIERASIEDLYTLPTE